MVEDAANGSSAGPCIWCLKDIPDVSFDNDAHIVPQSLGGRALCSSVCDGCNSYFGNHDAGLPPVEETIKEAIGISRAMFLQPIGGIGKNKALTHPSFRYYHLDHRKRTFKVKPAYCARPNLGPTLGRQLRRGLYKMYLETLSSRGEDVCMSRYDFIREFARYGRNDLPVFYFMRRIGVYLNQKELIESPMLQSVHYKSPGYLVETEAFSEFEIVGHVFGIVSREHSEDDFVEYLSKTREVKRLIFLGVSEVYRFEDIDLTLSALSETGGYERWLANKSPIHRF